MFNIVKKSITWGNEELTIETGKVARQADGAVVVTYGETVVLCTAVAQKQAKPDVDFFPLTVNYQEKWFAAGKIPGGFFKREGRPTEKETLVSRLIDRPIRPLFPAGFYNETQVICTVLAHDGVNDPDVVAMVGASAALAISGIPFTTPIGAARVGFIDGEYVLNPTFEALEDSALDLVVAGTKDSVMMVESEANCLTEEQMLGAVVYGHDHMQAVITLINELKDEAGKPVWEVESKDHSAIEAKANELGAAKIADAYKIQEKQDRSNALADIRDALTTQLLEAFAADVDGDDAALAQLTKAIGSVIKHLEQDVVRGQVLKTGGRIDGRDTKTVRNIVAETDILPKVHGSSLFTRGETQALVVATLGTSQDEQIIDSLEGDARQHFMLHYNFPPFSVGEAGFMRGPGRREIGHGKLAWRALRALLPNKDDFPYTIRLVSEITESNGSSSMATVCGSSLALMDAGVPVKAPVAGIAMGLIKEGDDFVVLSDILGDEDHLGDMDFKVAGTEEGISALQMDIKIDGITKEIMEIALNQAKEGRLHILSKMAEARSTSREGLNKNAPTITSITVEKDKIREIIGTGGKVIREICEVSGAKVDIDDEGVVKVAAVNKEQSDIALKMIQDIIAEVEIGTIYEGKVVRIVDFGAFVNVLGKQDGLVHISELTDGRVESVTDVVNEGDVVKVKVLDIDRGKIRLSMRVVDQETGEEIELENSNDNDSDGDRSSKSRRHSGKRRDNRDGHHKKGGSRKPSQRPHHKKRDDDHDDNDTSNSFDDDHDNDVQEEAVEKPKKKRKFFGQF